MGEDIMGILRDIAGLFPGYYRALNLMGLF